MPCLDTENDFRPGDDENVILRKILNRLCNVSSGGGGGGGGTLSTDGTFSANSDLLYPSQKAAKTYIDTGLAGKQNSLGYTPENVANKSNDTTLAADSATLYPTQHAVKSYVTAAVGAYVLKAGDTMTGLLTINAATSLVTSGNVGIGTASPAGRLHVSSADAAVGVLFAGATKGIRFGFAASSVILEGVDSTGGASYQPIAFGGTYQSFVVNGVTEVMRVATGGSVGIGITAPLAKLHVTPSASGTDYFRIDHSDGTPRFQVGSLPGSPSYFGLWANVTPSAVNYTLYGDGSSTVLGAPGAGSIFFSVSSGTIIPWTIPVTGHFFAGIDNTYDIGASGANRPRNGYFAGDIFGNYVIGTSGFGFGAGASTGLLITQSDGVLTLLNSASSSFNRLQFGGTTSSFPSIKRSAATLQARLADDSGFADVSVASIRTNNVAALVISSVAMNDGAAAAIGTLTNAPAAGNPTKWIPINDNGTVRYIPAW